MPLPLTIIETGWLRFAIMGSNLYRLFPSVQVCLRTKWKSVLRMIGTVHPSTFPALWTKTPSPLKAGFPPGSSTPSPLQFSHTSDADMEGEQ